MGVQTGNRTDRPVFCLGQAARHCVILQPMYIFPRLNVVTQLLALVLVAIALLHAPMRPLLVLLGVFTLANMMCGQSNFFNLVKRLKWFFLGMWLIYVFNTPGEHVHWQLFPITPTIEGIQAGNMQMLRILVMLSTLALVLAANGKEALMSGFACLLKPLRWIGLDMERFAARLWLTMHYVETQPDLMRGQHLMDFIRQALSETAIRKGDGPMEICWIEPAFDHWNIALIALMTCLAFLLM